MRQGKVLPLGEKLMKKEVRIVRVGVSLFAGVLASVSLSAQNLPSSGQPARPAAGPSGHSLSAPQAPTSFGLGSSNLSIPADAFVPLSSSTPWTYDGPSTGRQRNGASSDHWFEAPVNLPSGAHIYQIAFEGYDNDPAADMFTWLVTNLGGSAGTPSDYVTIASSSALAGWGYFFAPVDVTIDNYNNSYALQVSMTDNGGLHILRRASVYYTLQVSPAPGSATFLDVPITDPAFQYIEALAASGITVGCGGGNYCPDNPLTRRQMAVYLSKALGLYWPN
jgi:hypothetical protein